MKTYDISHFLGSGKFDWRSNSIETTNKEDFFNFVYLVFNEFSEFSAFSNEELGFSAKEIFCFKEDSFIFGSLILFENHYSFWLGGGINLQFKSVDSHETRCLDCKLQNR